MENLPTWELMFCGLKPVDNVDNPVNNLEKQGLTMWKNKKNITKLDKKIKKWRKRLNISPVKTSAINTVSFSNLHENSQTILIEKYTKNY